MSTPCLVAMKPRMENMTNPASRLVKELIAPKMMESLHNTDILYYT
jgi:hypothetical protein